MLKGILKQVAAVVEARAQIEPGFLELHMEPTIPKIIHEEFGGGYWEHRNGQKLRGRVRLYGAKSMEFLRLVLPHFVGYRKAEAEAVLQNWQKGLQNRG